jgi:N-acetylglucosamine-6-phosphate deacetylase
MATAHPAEMLGLTPRLGTIQIGGDATFTLVDWDQSAGHLAVRQTIVRGETVYGA